jgi:hypothetical protein
MSFEEFLQTTTASTPPPGLNRPLLALWLDARGDWDAAHAMAQEDDEPAGAWVHAYLHRKEGDLANAAYWYRQAERTPAKDDLRAEWETIARTLL